MKECLRQATAGGEGWCIWFSYKSFPFLWAGSNTWCHDGFREGASMFSFFVVYQLARTPAHETIFASDNGLVILFEKRVRRVFLLTFSIPRLLQLPWAASDVERRGLFIFLLRIHLLPTHPSH